jgi:hypothetical protein
MTVKNVFFLRGWRASLLLPLLIACIFSIASSRAIAADQPPPSDWLPSGIEQLGKSAELHTDFTFDKTMIQMSSGLVSGDQDTRNAIAKLNGITVHLYRYAAPGMYDPRQLDAIRQQYHAEGWKHLVSKEGHPAGAASPSPPPGSSYPTPPAPYVIPPDVQAHTDLFIKFQGTDVVGMVVMQSSARNLNVVAISGDLSPIDLLHLRGHFGIPKFSGDGFAPADN